MLPGTIEYKALRKIMDMEIPTDPFINAIHSKVLIDIVSLDAIMAKNDPLYDNTEGTYNYNPCSLSDYIHIKFGEKALQLFNALTS